MLSHNKHLPGNTCFFFRNFRLTPNISLIYNDQYCFVLVFKKLCSSFFSYWHFECRWELNPSSLKSVIITKALRPSHMLKQRGQVSMSSFYSILMFSLGSLKKSLMSWYNYPYELISSQWRSTQVHSSTLARWLCEVLCSVNWPAGCTEPSQIRGCLVLDYHVSTPQDTTWYGYDG